eukprot:13982998-Alexandrium_andersonii.AAC.1
MFGRRPKGLNARSGGRRPSALQRLATSAGSPETGSRCENCSIQLTVRSTICCCPTANGANVR